MSLTATDQFCGAGGSSIGLAGAGVEVVLGINHWPRAIETYGVNFPDARHALADMCVLDPRAFPATDILVTSPSCRTRSYAKGRAKDDPNLFDPTGLVEDEKDRATMEDVVRFAEVHRYKAIVLENVVQTVDWCEWQRNGHRERCCCGQDFHAWLAAMEALGYRHRLCCLNSAFFPPTPQSRDRLYIVLWLKGVREPNLDFTPPAWCVGCGEVVAAVQTWKPVRSQRARDRVARLQDRVGVHGAQYGYTCSRCAGPAPAAITPAIAAIDRTLPAVKIGEREQHGLAPLKPATMGRIERGVLDKVVNRRVAIIPLDRLPVPGEADTKRCRDAEVEPLPTQTTRQEQALVLSNMAHNVPRGAGSEPAATVTTGAKLALVVPGRENAVPRDASSEAMQTATTITSLYVLEGDDGVVVPLRRNTASRAVATDPVPTVCAGGGHHALVMRPHGSPDMPAHKQGTIRDAATEVLSTVPTKATMSLVVTYDRTATARDVATEALTTATTKHRYGLLDGERRPSIDIDECTFRMLEPHEIGAAMAMSCHTDGRPYLVGGTKRERVKQYGHAVTPPVMRELVARVAEALDA